MSIDPLNRLWNSGSGSFGKAATGSSQQTEKSFDSLLKAAETKTLSPRELSKQATEMVQIARMRMMQGMFDLLDDSNDMRPLARPQNPYSLLQQPPEHGQKLDSPHTKPTEFKARLTESVQSGRDEIENMIEQVAKHVSLAPDLIRSVVKTESDFKIDAISHAGAQGLMQLMPETAKELGVTDRLDPLQNLLGGSRYLKKLIDKYDGDLDHALAAYNWGQGNVDRKGLENMPLETRNYLKRVKTQLAG